jgi:hypothetical protein
MKMNTRVAFLKKKSLHDVESFFIDYAWETPRPLK